MAVVGAFMVPHPPMIVPEVGRGSEKQVQATAAAYRQAAREIARLKPDTIVISSPHSVLYSDYFHLSPGRGASGSFARFGAPQVDFRAEYDTELVKAAERLAETGGFPAGTLGEKDPALDHGTLVPLYFIRQEYDDFRLVRIGLSGLSLEDHYRMGQIIRQAASETGRRIVWVASGDLSHKLQTYGPYGFAPEGPEYDRRIMETVSRAAFGELFSFSEDFCERAAECGHRSFVMMAGALDGLRVEARQLSHEDVTGVGYGICVFRPVGADPARQFLQIRLAEEEKRLTEKRAQCDPWVCLAWQSVESWVLHRRKAQLPDDLPEELRSRRAGAFVSIHKQGQLRGCIGTIGPTQDCLAAEIIENAVSASSRDPRFQPIRPEELPLLEINVDVLGEPEDVDSEESLDAKRYGVIVRSGSRRGLLLPDLEGVDTPARQIAIARQKAGIGPREKISLQRFEVVRHR